MNRKIIGIFVMTLLIETAIIPVMGAMTELNANNISLNKSDSETINPPKPGCMNGEYPIFEINYNHQNRYVNKINKPSFNEEIISLISNIDDQKMLGYLENLTSFGPRVTATSACDESGEYIYNEFNRMGLDVRIHEWVYEDFYGDNIEATLHGVNESSDEIYIICAHYDSVPGSPGADDDGSGTATVLIAAEIMSQYVFDHTIRFVTFSGEEQGLYGSYFYVEEANESNDNIVAVLNVDMIGFAETEEDASKIRVYEDEFSEWVTAFTTEVGEQYYDYIGLEVIPSGYSWASDHYYFWEYGYNGIFYAEYNFNNYYHSPADTIEHMYIPYAVKCSKLITATLAELSQLTLAPFKPDIPDGSINGTINQEYTYISSTADPQDDDIFYLFDWGDGTNSGWIGLYNSGDECSASHIWTKRGDYGIKVKAKDRSDHESPWSDPLSVTMPKSKQSTNPLSLQFLENLIQRFPLFARLLQLSVFEKLLEL